MTTPHAVVANAEQGGGFHETMSRRGRSRQGRRRARPVSRGGRRGRGTARRGRARRAAASSLQRSDESADSRPRRGNRPPESGGSQNAMVRHDPRTASYSTRGASTRRLSNGRGCNRGWWHRRSRRRPATRSRRARGRGLRTRSLASPTRRRRCGPAGSGRAFLRRRSAIRSFRASASCSRRALRTFCNGSWPRARPWWITERRYPADCAARRMWSSTRSCVVARCWRESSARPSRRSRRSTCAADAMSSGWSRSRPGWRASRASSVSGPGTTAR